MCALLSKSFYGTWGGKCAQFSCISNSVSYRQWEFARWEVNAFLVVIHIHKKHLQYPTLYEVCKWLKITSLHLVPFQSLPQHAQVIQFSLLNHYFGSNYNSNHPVWEPLSSYRKRTTLLVVFLGSTWRCNCRVCPLNWLNWLLCCIFLRNKWLLFFNKFISHDSNVSN